MVFSGIFYNSKKCDWGIGVWLNNGNPARVCFECFWGKRVYELVSLAH